MENSTPTPIPQNSEQQRGLVEDPNPLSNIAADFTLSLEGLFDEHTIDYQQDSSPNYVFGHEFLEPHSQSNVISELKDDHHPLNPIKRKRDANPGGSDYWTKQVVRKKLKTNDNADNLSSDNYDHGGPVSDAYNKAPAADVRAVHSQGRQYNTVYKCHRPQCKDSQTKKHLQN